MRIVFRYLTTKKDVLNSIASLRCLQEISYLTSPAALNPLPTRLPLTLSIPSALDGEASNIHPTLDVEPRPKKVLTDVAPSGPFALASQVQTAGTGVDQGGEQQQPPQSQQSQGGMVNGSTSAAATGSNQAQDHQAPTSSQPQQIAKSSSVGVGEGGQDDNERILTAIYKPESREAWKEALKAANDKAEQVSYLVVEA